MDYISKQSAKDSESAQKITGITTPIFLDQRTSTTVQLKQQQMMNSAAVFQLTPTVIGYGNLQEFKFNGATGHVGSSMSAHLNPADPKVGSDTAGSNAYPGLFNELQSSTETSWVRGHLLNHDIGGVAHYNNLFPITTAVNNEHKYEVEYPVKHWLNEGCEIDYTVTAKKINTGDTDADGVFECNAQVTAGEKYRGKRIQKNIHSKTKKVTSERHFRKTNKQSVDGFSRVDHGLDNAILRDDYKAPKATDGWNHSKGNNGDNYFIHNGMRYPGKLADGTTKLSLLINELQGQLKNLPLDRYSSAYEPAVKQAKESMSNLRNQWNGVGLDIKKIITSDILQLLDNYLMKVYGRRPSQAVMVQEMGFTI